MHRIIFKRISSNKIWPLADNKHATAASPAGRVTVCPPQSLKTLTTLPASFRHESTHGGRHHSTRRDGVNPAPWLEGQMYTFNASNLPKMISRSHLLPAYVSKLISSTGCLPTSASPLWSVTSTAHQPLADGQQFKFFSLLPLLFGLFALMCPLKCDGLLASEVPVTVHRRRDMTQISRCD